MLTLNSHWRRLLPQENKGKTSFLLPFAPISSQPGQGSPAGDHSVPRPSTQKFRFMCTDFQFTWTIGKSMTPPPSSHTPPLRAFDFKQISWSSQVHTLFQMLPYTPGQPWAGENSSSFYPHCSQTDRYRTTLRDARALPAPAVVLPLKSCY